MTTFCRTKLQYVQGGESDRSGRHPTEVDILDARSADLPGWQVCGFELVRHTSAVADWDADDEVAAVHYPEIEELARKLTNSDFALVSQHITRGPGEAERHHQLSPVRFVHSDFAEDHAAIVRGSYQGARAGATKTLARNGLTADTVENAARIIILQFWRNLGPAKMDFPLAFCDARTVKREQTRPFHVTNYAGNKNNTFDALGIMAPDDPSDHGWYVFPELIPDEVVAFRTYDTDLVRDGKTYFTPHSAFRDPEVAIGEPARSSIELRATCVFA